MSVELQSYKVEKPMYENPAYTRDKEENVKPGDVGISIQDGCNGEITQSDDVPNSGYHLFVYKVQSKIYGGYSTHRTLIKRCVLILLLLLYFAYFGYAMYYKFGDEGSIRLLVCTVFGVLLLCLLTFLKLTKKIRRNCWKKSLKPCLARSHKGIFVLSMLLKVAVFIFLVVFIIVDVAIDSPGNLIPVAGQAIYIILFYVFSINPAKVKWHPIFWGFSLQYIFALIILRQEWGFQAFKYLGDRVEEFLLYANEGASFLFGSDLIAANIFAFMVLPIVVFFYTIISILYYLGVMQFIVRVLGRALAFCMGTTPAESLNAVGNIFVGMTEAPLMISPFLEDMTRSELHAVMTGGFATIAGSVLAAYVIFGVPANHLISASVMSAPAALAISKLSYPETQVSKASNKDFYKMGKSKERDVVEAASAGATASIKIVAAIAVNVMAFLSVLKFVNATLIWFGERVGLEDFTLQFICSYLFFPIAYFMGTDVSDCRKVAELIGVKTFTNEFIAYQDLGKLIKNGKDLANYTNFYNNSALWYWEKGNIVLNETMQTLEGGILSSKSEVIATYALCGFSNFGSMGILLGAMGALAPSRKSEIAGMVVRAMVSGTVACFLTACIAGLISTQIMLIDAIPVGAPLPRILIRIGKEFESKPFHNNGDSG